MPRGDRTGPLGMGRTTGRAAGYCAGFGVPGFSNPAPGRGSGTGFFRGRGAWSGERGGGHRWRNIFWATGLPGWMRGGFAAPYRIPFQQQDPEIEKQMLKNQAQILRQELGSIEKHLSEILKGTASQQQT